MKQLVAKLNVESKNVMSLIFKRDEKAKMS